jgi:hypothetical protein
LIGLGVLAVACTPAYPVHRPVEAEDSDGSASDGPAAFAPNPTGAANGVPCAANKECRSGACIDGVCCQSACTGACLACDVRGGEGRCLPVGDGQDPDGDCDEDPVGTCGHDGVCDGRGACRRYAAGTQCAPGGCRDATERAASSCDGLGKCQPGTSRSCAPALCVGDSCGTPCALHSDCQTGFYCDGGTCRTKRDQAASCTMNEQCGSGHCTEGVCCTTACTEKCYTCKGSGTVGTCTPVRDSLDPKHECIVQDQYTCGNAGGCNGRGACRLHVAGTPCGPGTCNNFTLVGPSSCDGMGACKPGPSKDCAPYVCNGPVCWTACATNDQCRAGRTCRVNTCE